MLFKHVLCFARIMSTLCPNSCRQTARIGGQLPPCPPRPVRLCPHTPYNTQKLEMVQRHAARYVCNHWQNTSSVTGMLSQLEWVPLVTRRANTRQCMIYRVAHTPVGDPYTPWLTFAQRTTRGSHAWRKKLYSNINITRRL